MPSECRLLQQAQRGIKDRYRTYKTFTEKQNRKTSQGKKKPNNNLKSNYESTEYIFIDCHCPAVDTNVATTEFDSSLCIQT